MTQHEVLITSDLAKTSATQGNPNNDETKLIKAEQRRTTERPKPKERRKEEEGEGTEEEETDTTRQQVGCPPDLAPRSWWPLQKT